MRLRVHTDADDFLASAGDWYRRSPIVHTIELSLLRRALPGPEDPLLLTVWEGDELVGAAMRTPPLALLCGGLTGAPLDETVRAVHGAGLAVPGVRGPRATTERFCRRWCAHTGSVAEGTVEERLYRLGTLTGPAGVAGVHRVARPADLPVLIRYQCDFAAEALGHEPDPHRAAAAVAAAGAVGDAYLLWTAHGAPVSMAAVRAPAAGVSRIGPVYTPPEVRGRGFGSAVTAAACRWALTAGARHVVLFADVANPASNHVYRKLGFVPVGDSLIVDLRVP
ncbi:GNAT family N-acetyltransferase [Mycobacterium sp. WMMD1722]|uniref:GNAT family N-acetyltransferase n=1 Tax=Mycobacterium sp. WMMD1722 TaxID=3404117 RepID=UPI003BF488AA